jgi:DNA-binding NtrC family response regulator
VDAVVLDYRLPDGNGFQLLESIAAREDAPPVIMLTVHSSIDHAVEAMKRGAYHYVSKPFDVVRLEEEVASAIRARQRAKRLSRREQREGEREVEALIGESSPMSEVKTLLLRIARSPAKTVLLTGESGTGKDLAAEQIHRASARAEAPFMNITCSALPEPLLESELFGHERGAFTDAKTRKLGLLEQADGGTVFLDEVAEMTPAIQAKLLRFLEQRKFRRVGGDADIEPDVRVVAATHVDLQQAVATGRFREDLFYRLAVLTVKMPPLRDRDGDIELLAETFVTQFARQLGRPDLTLSNEALALLRQHDWPGNVRELRNTIERAVMLSPHDALLPKDLEMFARSADAGGDVNDTMELPSEGVDFKELERDLLKQALIRTGGNRTKAAELLGMNRDQVRYRVAKFGLDKEFEEDE